MMADPSYSATVAIDPEEGFEVEPHRFVLGYTQPGRGGSALSGAMRRGNLTTRARSGAGAPSADRRTVVSL